MVSTYVIEMPLAIPFLSPPGHRRTRPTGRTTSSATGNNSVQDRKEKKPFYGSTICSNIKIFCVYAPLITISLLL